MNLNDRINAFNRLGELILTPCNSQAANRLWDKVYSAQAYNPWFTPDFCRMAFENIASLWLTSTSLINWVDLYPSEYFQQIKPKRVAVIMAGNVPLVGFHDLLCVLMSGHHIICKLSSKDGGLMQAVTDLLLEIEPRFSDSISFTDDKITDFDAVIATGSSNTARYFEFYFGKYHNIIRKNRNSIAVLSGNESNEQLEMLADDIFTYFGLGCRNVSKIFIPNGYNVTQLFQAFSKYEQLRDHNKYANNYEYHRAVYLMNQVQHLDNGFAILKHDYTLGSPVSVIFYEYFDNIDFVKSYIELNNDAIQCVISANGTIPGAIDFGDSQKPTLQSYADGIDTIKFLNSFG